MMNSEFAIDVDIGLSDANKYLSSKYFYDDKGSYLFQQIMELPEYYLTRAELNIFQTKSLEILKKILLPKVIALKGLPFLYQLLGRVQLILYLILFKFRSGNKNHSLRLVSFFKLLVLRVRILFI